MIRKSKSFTLLELLVVIAIIALLASILLPALKKAKDKVSTAQCGNNLRQLGIAMQSYLGDFDGYYVPYRIGSESTGYNWAHAMASNNYVTNNRIYFCPLAPYYFTTYSLPDYQDSAVKRPTAMWAYSWINYGYNAAFIGGNIAGWAGPASDLPSQRVSKLKTPSRTILMADAFEANSPQRSYFVISTNASTSPACSIHDRHSKGANLSWCDGHVSYQKNAILIQDGSQKYFTF